MQHQSLGVPVPLLQTPEAGGGGLPYTAQFLRVVLEGGGDLAVADPEGGC